MILLWLHDNRWHVGANHQHAAAGADRFIVDIDADNGIGAQIRSLLAHFAKLNISDLAKLRFIRRCPAAYDITNRREEIPEDVRAKDGIPRDQSQILDRFFPSILGVVDRIILPSR